MGEKKYDRGGEIVELFIPGDKEEWSRTTMRDVDFMCSVMGYDKLIHMRRIEGSIDGGVTWKVYYEEELMLLKNGVRNRIQWRVKGN